MCPSIDIAIFKVTSGRLVRACLRKDWLNSRAVAASSPAANPTSTPPSRRIPGPRPAAFSLGSSDAIITRAMPASRIASVQGGWRPSWAQGSSVTYIVAPVGSSPRPRQSSSAARSACSPPSSACHPSPITSPSRTSTAPTSGFGLTCPRPRPASSRARRRCSRSVSVSCAFIEPIDESVNGTGPRAFLPRVARREGPRTEQPHRPQVPPSVTGPAGRAQWSLDHSPTRAPSARIP